jgi:hypothetical protein
VQILADAQKQVRALLLDPSKTRSHVRPFRSRREWRMCVIAGVLVDVSSAVLRVAGRLARDPKRTARGKTVDRRRASRRRIGGATPDGDRRRGAQLPALP